jgi:hypothetical protein
MSEKLHSRAHKLLAQERVEGLSNSDRDWLSAHLHECESCSASARELESALRALRTEPVPFPSGLAARTQFRVQLRAQELREREPRHRLMWITCGVSWAFGVLSAPYVWRIFEWIGQRTGTPKLALEIGFGLWWAVPAVVAAAVVLMENSRQLSTSAWTERSRG